MVFDNETFSAYRLKNSFICNFWSWSNVSSGDRDRSLLEFLTWMGYRQLFLDLVGSTFLLFLVLLWAMSLLYTPSVLLGNCAVFCD